MRCHGYLLSWALALTAGAGYSAAASFGTVVPIGGTAADIALDESRGVLYIADFGSNTIDVLSLADNTIHTSLNVAPHPGSLALSPDAQFLVSTHYNNFSAAASAANLITVIQLNGNLQQTFATGNPPLAVAFLATGGPSGQALVVTTTDILLFDPISGAMQELTSIAALAATIPIQAPSFPGQITETAVATSGNGTTVWGILGAGTGTQLLFRYDATAGGSGLGHLASFTAGVWITSPSLLPRISPDHDGNFALIGWNFTNAQLQIVGRYPNVVESANITGHAYDPYHSYDPHQGLTAVGSQTGVMPTQGIIYAQIPDASQPTGPPLASSSSSSQPAGTGSSTPLPALLIMDADNLTYRDRITLPENLVGRGVLNSAGTVMYVISESGVTVLPVGSLPQYPRLAAGQEDVFIQTSYCNGSSTAQTFTLSDPGGGNTDFTITPSASGVKVSPSTGTTPATITVTVDSTVFRNANGTTPVTLNISSVAAVNQPRSVRVLVSNPDVNQRGTVVDVPGTLTDILADPGRNRFYVLRQDMNQVQVYDGGTNKLIATLRTATTPSQMAFTIDQQYLVVAHDDSQMLAVFDLNSLALASAFPLVVLPGGHYGRSVAASNAALLVLARDEHDFFGKVDQIDLSMQTATELPALGVWVNQVGEQAVLAPAPDGSNILLASPDGTVMLYSAQADTFTVARQDFKGLFGAYGASAYSSYIIDNYVFNASLVPVGTLTTSGGTPSGFAFIDRGGYLATSSGASSPGVMQSVPNVQSAPVDPTYITEAPLLPTTTSTSSSSSSTGSGSGTTGGSGTTSLNSATSFSRTVAPLSSAGTIVVLTTSGFTVLSSNYAAAVAPPTISSVVNAADNTAPVAPGGLISVYGQQMSPVNVATSQIPLPTALGQSCLSVNGAPIPLLFVSSQQINAQLPFNVGGSATLAVHTPGGISNNFNVTISPTAPSVFRSGTAGPLTGLATVLLAQNGQLVTPDNPIHPKDTITIYLTGMGLTSPQVSAGVPAPANPLALANVQPTLTLGSTALSVSYAGLAPGQVGLYQINASVPTGVPLGMDVPLVISQGGASTSLDVRVVN
jgi:uncharacterized protein (TIGR03437 family)